MSLESWQLALVDLVNGRDPCVDDRGLHPGDRSWFERAADHPGTLVTRDLARSARSRRLARSVPLTHEVLRRCGMLDDVRNWYLAETDAPSSYALAEGRQFLGHLVDRVIDRTGATSHRDRPHLATVVALESAVLRARGSAWSTNIRASRPDDNLVPGAGGLVRCRCDAGALLLGLRTGSDLPVDGSGHGAFVVAPGIIDCFREATVSEIRALTLVGSGCPAAEVSGLWPNDLIDVVTLTSLEAVGAVVRQPPRAVEPTRRPVSIGGAA